MSNRSIEKKRKTETIIRFSLRVDRKLRNCENGGSCLPLRLSSVKLYWSVSCDCVRTKEGGSKVNRRHELSIHPLFLCVFFVLFCRRSVLDFLNFFLTHPSSSTLQTRNSGYLQSNRPNPWTLAAKTIRTSSCFLQISHLVLINCALFPNKKFSSAFKNQTLASKSKSK